MGMRSHGLLWAVIPDLPEMEEAAEITEEEETYVKREWIILNFTFDFIFPFPFIMFSGSISRRHLEITDCILVDILRSKLKVNENWILVEYYDFQNYSVPSEPNPVDLWACSNMKEVHNFLLTVYSMTGPCSMLKKQLSWTIPQG